MIQKFENHCFIWHILEGDGSPSMLSRGAQGFRGCMCSALNRDKDITGFQFSLNRHLITAGPPFWPKSISFCHKRFSSVLRSKLAEYFLAEKHLNFEVIYVALAPDLSCKEFANQPFKSNTLFKKHRVDPCEERPAPGGPTETGQLVALLSRLLLLVLRPALEKQLIPACICVVILSSEVRQLD